VIRAVLDTNVLISAFLFSGPPSRLVPAWQAVHFRPVVSSPILAEYLRALAYPKFRLSEEEIRGLIEEKLLPFAETTRITAHPVKLVRDPDDAKFVVCALAASVPWIVSGDKDLLDLGRVESVQIVTVITFLDQLKRSILI
jgi:putative PIN family toxin of toxin-antitoxin system